VATSKSGFISRTRSPSSPDEQRITNTHICAEAMGFLEGSSRHGQFPAPQQRRPEKFKGRNSSQIHRKDKACATGNSQRSDGLTTLAPRLTARDTNALQYALITIAQSCRRMGAGQFQIGSGVRPKVLRPTTICASAKATAKQRKSQRISHVPRPCPNR